MYGRAGAWCVVDAGQGFMKCLVCDELPGEDRALEESILTVPVEPDDAGGVRFPAFTDDQQPSEKPGQVFTLLGSSPLFSENDPGKTHIRISLPRGLPRSSGKH